MSENMAIGYFAKAFAHSTKFDWSPSIAGRGEKGRWLFLAASLVDWQFQGPLFQSTCLSSSPMYLVGMVLSILTYRSLGMALTVVVDCIKRCPSGLRSHRNCGDVNAVVVSTSRSRHSLKDCIARRYLPITYRNALNINLIDLIKVYSLGCAERHRMP